MVWDVAGGQPIQPPLPGHTDRVLDVAFNPAMPGEPGSRLLASGSADGTIILWDIGTTLPLGQPLGSHTANVESIAFNPDGRLLASGGKDGTIILWDAATGQPIHQPLTGHTDVVRSLSFSPDGQTLATNNADGTISLWDVDTRQTIRQPLTGHTDRVESVAFSPDGQTLASGSQDRTIILWDVATHRPLGQPLLNNEIVWRVAFSPNGQTLASGDTGGAVIMWDVNPESWHKRACRIVARNLTPAEWERYLGSEPYRATCPRSPLPLPEAGEVEVAPQKSRTATPAATTPRSGPTPAAIVETFDSNQGFIQTNPNVYISEGQANWHIERNGGKQYIYHSIPPFSGNVRLTVRGQMDSWTNNCGVQAGIGDELGFGMIIYFGWNGGGCPTNGVFIDSPRSSVVLDRYEKAACEYTGNWLWVEAGAPYTAELETLNETGALSVEGVGKASGEVKYKGPYTTLWVGNTGRGDWPECTGGPSVRAARVYGRPECTGGPSVRAARVYGRPECTGTIDTIIVEPLD